MKILVVKPSSLGDVIHALPAVAALKEMPDVQLVDWVINDEIADLIEGSPVVNKVIRFPRHNFKALPAFIKNLRSESYDLVVDLQGLLRSAIISRIARAKKITGVADAREGAVHLYHERLVATSQHAVMRNMEAVRHLGAEISQLRFPLPPLAMPVGFDCTQSYILLHPFSKWQTKSLSMDWTQKLVDALQPQRVVLVGRGDATQIRGVEDWTNRTTLIELMALLKTAQGVISTDSGPLHISCALDTPTVALFGPTSPEKTGPWSNFSSVMRLKLPCVPCSKRTCAWKDPYACLKQIPTANVVQELQRLIGKKKMQADCCNKLLLDAPRDDESQ